MARGLALVIAGLIGIGMLTLMLRTPAETEEEKDPIESMRIIKLQSNPPPPAKDPESHSSVA
jgi:hypothetical protein